MTEQGKFLIVGNQRTGSTWFVLTLGLLPDVETDLEFAWAPWFTPERQHMVIATQFNSVSHAMRVISEESKVIGSKLLMHPRLHGRLELCHLSQTIEGDIAIIHLFRRPSEIFASFIRRFGHSVKTTQGDKAGHLLSNVLAKQTESQRMQTRTPEKEWIDRNYCIEMLRGFRRNDNWIRTLQRKHTHFMAVRYDELPARFEEVAKFIGSEASPDQIAMAAANSPIKKNPAAPIEDFIENADEILALMRAYDKETMTEILGGFIRHYGLRFPFVCGTYFIWSFLKRLRPRSRLRTAHCYIKSLF